MYLGMYSPIYIFIQRWISASTTEIDNAMCFAQMIKTTQRITIKVKDEKCEENTCHDIDERNSV